MQGRKEKSEFGSSQALTFSINLDLFEFLFENSLTLSEIFLGPTASTIT